MRARIVFALTLLGILASVPIVGPAHAVAPTSVTSHARLTTTVTAPITCAPNEDSCNLGYIVNGGNGYVAFQQATGGIWVRASKVAGWDNSQSPPITCKYSTSCVYDYVGGASIWRARQASQPDGPWVQLTRTPGS